MTRLLVSLIITVILSSCIKLTDEDRAALKDQLSKVRNFETIYLMELAKLHSKRDFIKLFKKVRVDVQELVRARENLVIKSPALKNYRIYKRSIPPEYREEYLEILIERRDISKEELDLMKKFNALELDTPDVYILGDSIKKSAFIDD